MSNIRSLSLRITRIIVLLICKITICLFYSCFLGRQFMKRSLIIGRAGSFSIPIIIDNIIYFLLLLVLNLMLCHSLHGIEGAGCQFHFFKIFECEFMLVAIVGVNCILNAGDVVLEGESRSFMVDGRGKVDQSLQFFGTDLRELFPESVNPDHLVQH
jgi:hypothetical protein